MVILFPAQVLAQDKFPKDEYAFQCGALYGILWKISEAKTDHEQVKILKENFDKLAAVAERHFLDSGKSKGEAESHMQRYVDDLVAVSIKDGSVLRGFQKVCDKYIQKQ
jgi:hypothetical protein